MPRKKKQPQRDRTPSEGKEPRHDPSSASARYASADEVREEFSEAQRLASGGDTTSREDLERTTKAAKLSGGDIDADWKSADVGEETVGGSNPTPDQDVVDEIGQAVGLPYGENEPLRLGDKETARDEKRWELDPASAEDYPERVKEERGGDIPKGAKPGRRAS